MKTFKNKNFTKRDYEATNVVYCIAEKAPSDEWIETSVNEIYNSKCNQLYRENDVVYFGWL